MWMKATECCVFAVGLAPLNRIAETRKDDGDAMTTFDTRCAMSEARTVGWMDSFRYGMTRCRHLFGYLIYLLTFDADSFLFFLSFIRFSFAADVYLRKYFEREWYIYVYFCYIIIMSSSFSSCSPSFGKHLGQSSIEIGKILCRKWVELFLRFAWHSHFAQRTKYFGEFLTP